MTKQSTNQPQINPNRSIALLGAFASATAYAMLLSTRPGRKWTNEQTWSTVVAGVMLTTGWVALENRTAAALNALYFMATGIPLIVRSLWLQLVRWDAVMQRGAE